MSDYISRKAAIAYIREQSEELQKVFEEHGGDSGIYAIYADAYNDLAEDFHRIPAADVEPVVRANWQFLPGSPGTVRCSNCGAEFEENPYAQYRGKWIGCPACLAKMQMIMDLEDENYG